MAIIRASGLNALRCAESVCRSYNMPVPQPMSHVSPPANVYISRITTQHFLTSAAARSSDAPRVINRVPDEKIPGAKKEKAKKRGPGQ